jgi:hypothetical protein
MILIFIIYVILAILLAFFSPKGFVAFYILATTKFLGFFDTENFFIFQGLGLANPILHIIIFTVVLFKGKLRKIDKNFRFYALGIISFLIYGVFKPFSLGLETFFEAIMASKEFWSISFFLYLSKFKRSIPLNYLIKLIIAIGVYLSLTYIIYFLLKLAPPFYITEISFRAFFPTYISLAWFFTYYLWLAKINGTFTFIVFSLIFSVGLILAGHDAITITTIVSIALSAFIFKGKSSISVLTGIRIVIFALILPLIVFFSKPLNNYISTLISGEDVSLSSRESYNIFRWQAIYDRPLFGYGFVHKNALINQEYIDFTTNRFTERFEVIDSGYVDILIKFGFVGLFFMLLIWAQIIKLAFTEQNSYLPMKMVCGLYLLQYFVINYTWSVFT